MLRTSAPHIYISYYTYKSSHIYLFIDPRSFPLTDATSLLMRLQMEPESIGIDLKDRWREVGKMYQNIVEILRLCIFSTIFMLCLDVCMAMKGMAIWVV